MTPEGAKASYRRFLTDRFTVTRNQQGGTIAAFTASNVHGRMKEYVKPRGAEDNTQGWQRAIVLVDDLIANNFPVPMKNGDIITVQGRSLKVVGVDQNTRKVDQTVIAYECIVQGS